MSGFLKACAVLGVTIVAVMRPGVAHAQITVPSEPVVFCGQQALPTADTYTVVIDGGAVQSLAMQATVDSRCPAGTTHSFAMPAPLFPIGSHTVQVTAINAFGSTPGPVYTVQVGIAPGQFTITAVLSPAQ